MLLLTNAGKYETDLITELHYTTLTVFYCTLEVSKMQSVYEYFLCYSQHTVPRDPWGMSHYLLGLSTAVCSSTSEGGHDLVSSSARHTYTHMDTVQGGHKWQE